MPRTDAQKRALNNYRKKNVKQVTIRFYQGEEDQALYEWIKSRENVTGYLKNLVKEDMKVHHN